jgi:hypothetical protein
VKAYERRYRRQLRDVGIATAIAQHDPQGLDQAFGPGPGRPREDAFDRSKKWW